MSTKKTGGSARGKLKLSKETVKDLGAKGRGARAAKGGVGATTMTAMCSIVISCYENICGKKK